MINVAKKQTAYRTCSAMARPGHTLLSSALATQALADTHHAQLWKCSEQAEHVVWAEQSITDRLVLSTDLRGGRNVDSDSARLPFETNWLELGLRENYK